jgi:hypothetical protein
MLTEKATGLREAIENLMNVTLLDVLSQPDRLARLNSHRLGGVASHCLRSAELRLEEALSATIIPNPPPHGKKPGSPSRKNTDSPPPRRRAA